MRFPPWVHPQRISGQPDCQRRQPHRVLRRQLRPADLSAAGGNSQGQSLPTTSATPVSNGPTSISSISARQVHSGPVSTLAVAAPSFSTGREGTSHATPWVRETHRERPRGAFHAPYEARQLNGCGAIMQLSEHSKHHRNDKGVSSCEIFRKPAIASIKHRASWARARPGSC